MRDKLSFTHRLVKGTRDGTAPLLLLHGTGGDEDDLIPLGRLVAPGAPLLSPRGKVLEGGIPRFFRRLAEGVFDEEDVRRRSSRSGARLVRSANGISHDISAHSPETLMSNSEERGPDDAARHDRPPTRREFVVAAAMAPG